MDGRTETGLDNYLPPPQQAFSLKSSKIKSVLVELAVTVAIVSKVLFCSFFQKESIFKAINQY